MHILAVVPSLYDTSPGQRFRIEQWEPFLSERSVSITYAPFESKELHAILYKPRNLQRKVALLTSALNRRRSLLSSIRENDAVYLFREAALLGPPIFERKIHRSGVPLIFDFDDAIFVRYRSPSNGYLSYLKFAAKTKSICRMAAHVTVGNAYLASYARQFNSRVTIIPTTIDTNKYTVESNKPQPELPVVGWTGSFSTVQHLDTLRGALRRLAQRERFRLRVIGTPTYEIEGVEVESLPWRAESELEDLKGIDIGIMPLPDESWSKGKCGLKALQFMALGLPTVCSPVGVNTTIVQDGKNGFIATTEDEWVEKLSQLLHSPQLRQQLGVAGRATVEERYSAAAQAPRFYQVLESVVRRSPEVVHDATSEVTTG
jgi:glycosyltransferase involved in cell wall biosynthesis